MEHPIDNIQWLPAESLTANGYNPNIVYNPELRLLELSLLQNGWLHPIIIDANRQIIDGFHRVQLAMDCEKLVVRDGGMVPCSIVEVSDSEAKLLTIRINRAKGTHIGLRMSHVVRDLLEDGMTGEDIALGIGATRAEIELLSAGDVFTQKNIRNAKYSKAWIPVEEKNPAV